MLDCFVPFSSLLDATEFPCRALLFGAFFFIWPVSWCAIITTKAEKNFTFFLFQKAIKWANNQTKRKCFTRTTSSNFIARYQHFGRHGYVPLRKAQLPIAVHFLTRKIVLFHNVKCISNIMEQLQDFCLIVHFLSNLFGVARVRTFINLKHKQVDVHQLHIGRLCEIVCLCWLFP